MLNANDIAELPARLAELARPNGGALRRLDVSENGPLAASGATFEGPPISAFDVACKEHGKYRINFFAQTGKVRRQH